MYQYNQWTLGVGEKPSLCPIATNCHDFLSRWGTKVGTIFGRVFSDVDRPVEKMQASVHGRADRGAYTTIRLMSYPAYKRFYLYASSPFVKVKIPGSSPHSLTKTDLGKISTHLTHCNHTTAPRYL